MGGQTYQKALLLPAAGSGDAALLDFSKETGEFNPREYIAIEVGILQGGGAMNIWASWTGTLEADEVGFSPQNRSVIRRMIWAYP